MSQLEYTPPPSLIPFLTSDKFINLVIGPVGCLRGDTQVLTEFGPIPIADIDRPMRVLSWNAKSRGYQLSQASVSFPKGMGYLYRIVTSQGEFDAAEHHQLLCADGVYRHVQELRVGDVVKTCSDTPQLTSAGFFQSTLREGVQHWSRTHEGYQGGYAMSDRLHGLLVRGVEAGVLVSVPAPSGAQASFLRFAPSEVLQSDALRAELSTRIRSLLCADQIGTDGSFDPVVHLRALSAGHTAIEFSVYDADSDPECQQSVQTFSFHLPVHVPAPPVQDLVSPQCYPLSSTDGTIVAIERRDTQAVYWDLHVGDTHNYVTVDGAIHHNSTKTTAGILKIAYEAKRIAACKDGIRRSRVIWIRQSREQLRDTSIPDFLRWFPDGQAGVFEKTNYKFVLKFDDVECEILFRGLDDASDVRRLLSLQATFGIADEFRELNPDVFEALLARLGRYPSKADNGVGCKDDNGNQIDKFWGMSNPPDADTYFEKFINDPPENACAFIQPSGMSPEADWLQYLKDGYYENLAEGKSQEYIDVYIHSRFGKSLSGQPVFRAFDRDTHVASGPLTPFRGSQNPLIIGVDFGLTPAATISQIDPMGRFITYADLVSEGMGILRFCREKLKPLLASRFAGMPVVIIGDPAGVQRAQTDERSAFDILKQEGFRALPAKTNSIVARISAVDALLTRVSDGKPAHIIDPGCKNLIAALRGGYRYKTKSSGETDDKPEKNKHSHVSDAHQYACLHANGNLTGGEVKTQAQPVQRVRYMWS